MTFCRSWSSSSKMKSAIFILEAVTIRCRCQCAKITHVAVDNQKHHRELLRANTSHVFRPILYVSYQLHKQKLWYHTELFSGPISYSGCQMTNMVRQGLDSIRESSFCHSCKLQRKNTKQLCCNLVKVDNVERGGKPRHTIVTARGTLRVEITESVQNKHEI